MGETFYDGTQQSKQITAYGMGETFIMERSSLNRLNIPIHADADFIEILEIIISLSISLSPRPFCRS